MGRVRIYFATVFEYWLVMDAVLMVSGADGAVPDARVSAELRSEAQEMDIWGFARTLLNSAARSTLLKQDTRPDQHFAYSSTELLDQVSGMVLTLRASDNYLSLLIHR